jgi:putative hydrolase of the HAD superfamily
VTNFAEIDCWIFDLDNTLYPASTDLFSQINVKMSNYIMNLLDVDKIAADKMRAEYWKKYGTSLAGLMQNHKVDPEDFLSTVHDIDFSALAKDPKLLSALNKLHEENWSTQMEPCHIFSSIPLSFYLLQFYRRLKGS